VKAHANQRGQASILLLGVVAALIAGALILAAFGQAYGARAKSQRVADLSAIAAAQAMLAAYPRLFEPPFLQAGVPNPRHLSKAGYLDLARNAAVRGAASNGGKLAPADIRFPDAASFAPTQVRVTVHDQAQVRVSGRGPGSHRHVPVEADATAELSPGAGQTGFASGGGYTGPLAYRQGKPMRPDVALAFDRMERAAAADGVHLIVSSGFRSDAEQAVLFAQHPDPRWVARPGTSLHRLATELDLGPRTAYGWLAANAGRFGFLERYSWEPWHYGYTRSPGTASVGFGTKGGDGRATAAVQSFVPSRYAPILARAAQRWGVSAHLLAAQIYAESNFNPFAVSPAGAQGIAQFMPGTAAGLGLSNPFDATAAIDAQAHLMHNLLARFASVPLALAAYNAGEGAVASCGCVPPYPETQAYVAKIVGLLGGAGEAVAGGMEVRLVE
jgi:transglycosylase-like protein with SLT domain/D-alanyl-D-alanine carboxypeptidase-like protein/putative Flp pilus-assembly TadE/G-like protein